MESTKSDQETDLDYAAIFADEESPVSLTVRMLNEIDLACSESRPFIEPMSHGLIELWNRVDPSDERLAIVRQLTDVYARFMDSIWSMDGFMSSYAKNDVWLFTQSVRSKIVQNVLDITAEHV